MSVHVSKSVTCPLQSAPLELSWTVGLLLDEPNCLAGHLTLTGLRWTRVQLPSGRCYQITASTSLTCDITKCSQYSLMRQNLYSGIISYFILSSPRIRQVGSELESNLAKERSTLHFRHRDKRERGGLGKFSLENSSIGSSSYLPGN